MIKSQRCTLVKKPLRTTNLYRNEVGNPRPHMSCQQWLHELLIAQEFDASSVPSWAQLQSSLRSPRASIAWNRIFNSFSVVGIFHLHLCTRYQLKNVFITQQFCCDHVRVGTNVVTEAQPCRNLIQLVKVLPGSRNVLFALMPRACTVQRSFGVGNSKASIPEEFQLSAALSPSMLPPATISNATKTLSLVSSLSSRLSRNMSTTRHLYAPFTLYVHVQRSAFGGQYPSCTLVISTAGT